ncbi:MAG: magnetosome protein MamI [Thermodesulfobacteriota bacterium]|nr:magnetosome protein MamI [Thermodesulfobacteriota bacterium]
MKHIIIGLVAITLGVWGIVLNWYQFLDLLWVLVPVMAAVLGVISLLAGISNFSKTSKTKNTGSIDERLSEGDFDD